MNELLQELVGQEVRVWVVSSPADKSGVLYLGNRWLSLTSDTDSTRLMPTKNIRLIKMAGGSMKTQSAIGELPPSLVGRTISVSSGMEPNYSDIGELEAFDDDWLRVRVGKSQLYFCISNIMELRLL